MIKTDIYRQKIRDLSTILTEAGYSLWRRQVKRRFKRVKFRTRKARSLGWFRKIKGYCSKN